MSPYNCYCMITAGIMLRDIVINALNYPLVNVDRDLYSLSAFLLL